MSNNFKRDFLKSLAVERVRDSGYSYLLNEFTNRINSGLSDILTQGSAQLSDIKNEMAVYIIHTTDQTLSLLEKNDIHLTHNVILLYFALRPGLLYKPLLKNDPSREFTQLYVFLRDYSHETDIQNRSKLTVGYLEKHPDVTFNEAASLIDDYKTYTDLMKRRPELFKDHDGLDFQKYVRDTSGAVELVLFCANQLTEIRDMYQKLHFDCPMGKLPYWNFIFPIIRSAVDIIGGQYVYLFAADNGILTSTEHTLIDYYKDYLSFSIGSELSPVKPIFDCSCVFMWQRIREAEEIYRDFQDTIENDPNAVLI